MKREHVEILKMLAKAKRAEQERLERLGLDDLAVPYRVEAEQLEQVIAAAQPVALPEGVAKSAGQMAWAIIRAAAGESWLTVPSHVLVRINDECAIERRDEVDGVSFRAMLAPAAAPIAPSFDHNPDAPQAVTPPILVGNTADAKPIGMVRTLEVMGENREALRAILEPAPAAAPVKPLTLGLDGNQWGVVFGDNIQEGCAGFGDTPDEAMDDFATRWLSERGKLTPAAVPEMDWRGLYRLQTAMRYMDNIPELLRDKAFAWADRDVAIAERAAQAQGVGDGR